MLASFSCSFPLYLCWAVCQSWQVDGWNILYIFSHPGGFPYAYLSIDHSINLSIHPPVSFRRQLSTGTFELWQKEVSLRTIIKITQDDLNIKSLKSSLHIKFKGYGCHTTAPITPVKATTLLSFQACEISLTLKISPIWKLQSDCNFRLFEICVTLEIMNAEHCIHNFKCLWKPNVWAGISYPCHFRHAEISTGWIK